MEIYDYLMNITTFDDKAYLFLVDKYGVQKVEQVINEVTNNGYVFLKLDDKIKLDDGCYDIVIEKVLLSRINNIKLEFDRLTKQCRIDVSMNTTFYDKMIKIGKNNVDDYLNNMFNLLYQEFVVIRNKIWTYYLPLLNEILDKYKDDSKYEDIYQESAMALMMVIEKFGVNNYDFKGYAGDYIRYNINYHYHDLDLCLQMPMSRRHKYYKMFKIIQEYMDKHHKMPTYEQLSKMLGLPRKAIITLLSLAIFDTTSLMENTFVQDEYMKNEEIIGYDEDIRHIENEAIDVNLSSLLKELLNCLSDSEQMVIYNYYLANNKLDNSDIARKLNVSYGTVMNIKRRALTKLRRHKDELGEYLR